MSVLLMAFGLLSLAVLLGTVLAAWHLRATEGGGLPPVVLGFIHGGLGAIGLIATAWVLLAGTGPIGALGWDGLALLGGALLAGIAIPLLTRRRSGNVGAAMALHGSVAIIGYVILMAYVSVR